MKGMHVKNLEERHQSYLRQRAQDKYDGNVGQGFPLKEFREYVDHLAELVGNVEFDEEDLIDIARMAQLRRSNGSGRKDGTEGVSDPQRRRLYASMEE
jgi:hypothetical protein